MKFKVWDSLTADCQRKGTQLFCCAPIKTSIYPYIALEVVETFGGKQTYMNRVFLYSEEFLSSTASSSQRRSSFQQEISKATISNKIDNSREYKIDNSRELDNIMKSADSTPSVYVSSIPSNRNKEITKSIGSSISTMKSLSNNHRSETSISKPTEMEMKPKKVPSRYDQPVDDSSFASLEPVFTPVVKGNTPRVQSLEDTLHNPLMYPRVQSLEDTLHNPLMYPRVQSLEDTLHKILSLLEGLKSSNEGTPRIEGDNNWKDVSTSSRIEREIREMLRLKSNFLSEKTELLVNSSSSSLHSSQKQPMFPSRDEMLAADDDMKTLIEELHNKVLQKLLKEAQLELMKSSNVL